MWRGRDRLLIVAAAAGLSLTLGGVSPGAADLGPDGDGVTRFYGQTLTAVEWTGNEAVSSAVLGRASGWINGALFDESMWQELAPRVRGSYAPLGYLTCRVNDVELSPEGGGLRARIRLDEGQRYRFGSIEIDGVADEEAEVVRRDLGLEPGDTWSPDRLEEGIGRVLERQAAEGRPYTQVRVRQVTLQDGLASVAFLVVKSDTVRVDSVRVDGLGQTREQLVHRIVKPLVGQPYDPAAAADARAGLLSLGVFTHVSAAEFLLTSPGRGQLVYHVEEAASNAFEGAFGYQGEGQGALGFARLHIGNLAGTARQADLVWEGRGHGVSFFDLHYAEPFVAGLPVRGDLNFSQELQGQVYTRTDAGLSATFGMGRGGNATLGLGAGRVVVGAGPVASSSRRGVRLELNRGSGIPLGTLGALRIGSYRFGLLAGLDLLNETLRESGEKQGRLSTLGLDAGITQPTAGSRFLSLALHCRARFSGERAIPVYDLFPVGGVQSLRGYREDAFRAAHLALLRAEYGLVFPRSRLFLFLDQAIFYRAREALDSTGRPETRYRAGYGLGTSYVSPLGELALLLGWGEGTGPLDAKLHLQLLSRF
jgi:translocation and assembly module TamA